MQHTPQDADWMRRENFWYNKYMQDRHPAFFTASFFFNPVLEGKLTLPVLAGDLFRRGWEVALQDRLAIGYLSTSDYTYFSQ